MAQTPNGSNIEAEGTLGTTSSDTLGRKKSEIKALNVQFGNLNPLSISSITGTPFRNNSDDIFQSIGKMAYDSESINILPKGPFVAVTLRIEINQNKQETEENWTERAQSVSGNEVFPLFSVRARIPELHSHIPVPLTDASAYANSDDGRQYNNSSYESLADGNKIPRHQRDNQIVDMYPLFSCTDPEAKLPSVGDLIWVDFLSSPSSTKGIYIKKLGNKATTNTEKIYNKSSNPFNNGKNVQNNMGIGVPKGQTNSPVPSNESQVPNSKIV